MSSRKSCMRISRLVAARGSPRRSPLGAPSLLSALIFAPLVALAAGPSLATHQMQSARCRAALMRGGPAGSNLPARLDAARRAEECLVQANDAAIPLLSRGAGEGGDVPNAVQTYRDASAALCGLLAEKEAETEAPAARAQCAANRESDLARLIDEYAAGGKPPSPVVTGIAACDDAFRSSRSADASAGTTLATCAVLHVKAKAASFVSKSAGGDPLGTLSRSEEEVAAMFGTSVSAGNGVCDVLVPAAPAQRARCQAAVAASIARAVAGAAQ
jgi:hypothetical protein